MTHEQRQIRIIADQEWGYLDAGSVAQFQGEPTIKQGVEYDDQVREHAERLGIQIVKSADISEKPGGDEYVMASGIAMPTSAEIKAAVPSIAIPSSETYEEFNEHPHFPILAKQVGASQGVNKYLLENPDQWERMKRYVTGVGPFRAVDETENPIPEPQRNQTRGYSYDQFIETPGEHYTSYRVLVSATGEVMASSLHYSAETKDDEQPLTTPGSVHELDMIGASLSDYLTAPDSLVYLGARSVVSNRSKGGNGIVLDPTPESKPTSDKDKSVLRDHGLDEDKPQLPEIIREQSQALAQAFGKQQGIVLGIDWIQDKETGEFYFLELNAGPAPGAFADAHLGGADKVSLDTAVASMEKAALDSLHRYLRHDSPQ
jgi:hypothetical protein